MAFFSRLICGTLFSAHLMGRKLIFGGNFFENSFPPLFYFHFFFTGQGVLDEDGG